MNTNTYYGSNNNINNNNPVADRFIVDNYYSLPDNSTLKNDLEKVIEKVKHWLTFPLPSEKEMPHILSQGTAFSQLYLDKWIKKDTPTWSYALVKCALPGEPTVQEVAYQFYSHRLIPYCRDPEAYLKKLQSFFEKELENLTSSKESTPLVSHHSSSPSPSLAVKAISNQKATQPTDEERNLDGKKVVKLAKKIPYQLLRNEYDALKKNQLLLGKSASIEKSLLTELKELRKYKKNIEKSQWENSIPHYQSQMIEKLKEENDALKKENDALKKEKDRLSNFKKDTLKLLKILKNGNENHPAFQSFDFSTC